MSLISLSISRFQSALQSNDPQGIDLSRRALSALANELALRLYEKEQAAVDEAISVIDAIERADKNYQQKLNEAIGSIHRVISFDSEIAAMIEAAQIKKTLARG